MCDETTSTPALAQRRRHDCVQTRDVEERYDQQMNVRFGQPRVPLFVASMLKSTLPCVSIAPLG